MHRMTSDRKWTTEDVIVVDCQAGVKADVLCLGRETWQAQAISRRTREQCHQARRGAEVPLLHVMTVKTSGGAAWLFHKPNSKVAVSPRRPLL